MAAKPDAVCRGAVRNILKKPEYAMDFQGLKKRLS
jgi:hypothetical protein